MAAPAATVRPVLSSGQLVDVTGSLAPVERVQARVMSVDDDRVVLRGRHLRADPAATLGLSYNDGVALIDFEVRVDDVTGSDVTVSLPGSARRIQRRAHARIAVSVPVQLLIPRSSGRTTLVRATTSDLSAGGAAVRVGRELPAGLHAPFTIHCDDDLVLTGVAMVIEDLREQRDLHRVRLQFEQLRPADRDLLAGWIFRQQVEAR